FGLVFIALVAHAIIRHRLMDLRLVIHRGLTLVAAMLVSLLPVAIFLTVAWPRLSLHLHLESHELVVLLAAIALVSLLIPLIPDLAGQLLDRYVYRTHANYQRTLREASRALTGFLDLKALLPFLTETVPHPPGVKAWRSICATGVASGGLRASRGPFRGTS